MTNKTKTTDENIKRGVGRPRSYTDSNELEKDIESYFESCEKREKQFITKKGEVIMINQPAPQHITGLCAFLGISNDTLNNYQAEGDDEEKGQYFGSVIARAKKRCEEYAVNQCFEGNKGNKADFILMNNFGWKNKTETDNKNPPVVVQTVYIEKEEKEEYEKHIDEVIKNSRKI